MKMLGKTNALILSAAAVLGVVALVAVVADAMGVAVLAAVLLLELLVLLAVLDRLGQRSTADALARATSQQQRDIAALGEDLVRIDRRVANVAERAVTEARATERAVIAALEHSGSDELGRR